MPFGCASELSEDELGIPICFLLLMVVTLLFSMDSDLEAFSHNPTDGSFTALADQLNVFTNFLNQRFVLS